MTQMESPKRKMQKKNDYQRHKLFRKIKRRRKAQAEAEQQVAMKQLRKKLKLPKFENGKTREVYTSDIHFNNDDTTGGVDRYGNEFDYVQLPETVITARKIPTFKDIEKQIGRKITQDEIDKVIAVDPQIPIEVAQPIEKGMYSPSITNELTNTIVGTAGDAINYLANKIGLPNLAPNEQLVETRDGDALFDLPGYGQATKLSLYGLGRYGGKFGLKKLQKLSRQKLLEKEFALSNGMYTIDESVLPSKITHIQNDSQPFTFDYDNPFSQYIKRDDKRIGEYITSGGESDVYNAIDGKSVIKFKDGIYQPSQNFDELQSAIQAEDKLNNLPFFFKQKYLGWSDKHDVIKAKKKVYPEDTFYTILSQPKVTTFSKVADPWFTLTENDGRQGVFRFFDKDKIYDYLKNYGVERTSEPGVYKYNGITFGDVRPQNAGIDKNGNFGFFDLLIHNYNSGKDIRIKKSKRGTFTKAAKQHGMSVQGFANRVLRNPSKYSAAMRKKANFARNASKWNK